MTPAQIWRLEWIAIEWFRDHLPGRVKIETVEVRYEQRDYGWEDWVVLAVEGERIDLPFRLGAMSRRRVDPRVPDDVRYQLLAKDIERAMPMLCRRIQGMLAEYWRWQ